MKRILVLLSAIIMTSCATKEEKMQAAEEKGNEKVAVTSKLIDGAGQALQKEGKEAVESASKGIGELVKGTNSGFKESLSSSDVICDSSFLSSFENCKANKSLGAEGGNLVNVYLVAKTDFKGDLMLKAFDKNKREIGRASLKVAIKKDEAKYVDFTFDERTDLMQADFFKIK